MLGLALHRARRAALAHPLDDELVAGAEAHQVAPDHVFHEFEVLGVGLQGVAQAEAVLELPGETQERVAVGMSVAGQIRELQLRLRVRFRLRGQQGQEWIPSTELLQQRDISYNETIALSKEGEEAMLFRNMRTDLVQQLMRRLAAVKTP